MLLKPQCEHSQQADFTETGRTVGLKPPASPQQALGPESAFYQDPQFYQELVLGEAEDGW